MDPRLEGRGRGDALVDADPPIAGFSRDLDRNLGLQPRHVVQRDGSPSGTERQLTNDALPAERRRSC
jgi:hypothetical protein